MWFLLIKIIAYNCEKNIKNWYNIPIIYKIINYGDKISPREYDKIVSYNVYVLH